MMSLRVPRQYMVGTVASVSVAGMSFTRYTREREIDRERYSFEHKLHE